MGASFDFDSATMEIISNLKNKFGAETNSQVIRKCLALAIVAARNSDSDNILTIISPNKEIIEIFLDD